ncbi:MAG: general secretion pathway protein GspB [Desulfobulbaceae bacterium]|uniref:General secretion pathway protein GspB n=1 Tax=Candidatus Desulfobia pelagia TaxID=2841692 RepID=A0A8J6N9M6_9BACT|nr:general secretion pathway protein GspB [Candidatus Desulfobia pelagia]
MSYILEALKKSDQKRQKGHIPDLNTVQSERPPEDNKKIVWPYFLAAILLLNAVILIVVMRPDQSVPEPQTVVYNPDTPETVMVLEKEREVEPQPLHVVSPPTMGNSPETVIPAMAENIAASQGQEKALPAREESAPVSVVPDRIIEEADSEILKGMDRDTNQEDTDASGPESVNAATAEDVDIDPVQEVAFIGAIEEDEVIEEVVEEVVLEQEHLVSPEDSVLAAEPEAIETETLPEEQLEVSKSISGQERRKAMSQTSALNTEKNSAGRKPLHLMQLPLAVRGELPEFQISAHVYFAKKPASRLASINGKIVREGDTLDSHLRVEEIVSDGVVFSYQKYLFHVPVL